MLAERQAPSWHTSGETLNQLFKPVVFSAHGQASYAEKIAAIHRVPWGNVDLTSEEGKFVPDINPIGIGTGHYLDFDLRSLSDGF